MNMPKKQKPIIGITLDWEVKGTFSDAPYYALRENYFTAIYNAGGIPIAIPYIKEEISTYLNIIDGLVIPGGDFAFPKEWYLDKKEQSPYNSTPRLEFDIEIIKAALELNKPLLTICAGMQILACLHGAKLTSQIKTNIEHRSKKRNEFIHDINIVPATLLAEIIKTNKAKVNSVHIEGLTTLNPADLHTSKIIVNAAALDGTTEAISIKNQAFALGVQWHPEFFSHNEKAKEEPIHEAIFMALIKNAK